MNRKRVIIFTEGGIGIGFGHITRCLALYTEIISRGYEVQFIVYGSNIEKILKNENYTNLDWKDIYFLDNLLKKTDYVIIDSYLANKEIYDYIAQKVYKVLYIDDNNRIKYPKGIILNPSLYISFKYTTDNIVLQGKDYLIIRKDFFNLDRNQKKIYDILITVGGTDIRNITPKLIKILKEINREYKIAIIIGEAFENKKEIESLKNEKISLFYNLNVLEMGTLIIKSKLVICGCGQSIYEMLALKAKFLPIVIAENQIENKLFLCNNIFFKELLSWKEIKKIKVEIKEKIEEKNFPILEIKNGIENIVNIFIGGI